MGGAAILLMFQAVARAMKRRESEIERGPGTSLGRPLTDAEEDCAAQNMYAARLYRESLGGDGVTGPCFGPGGPTGGGVSCGATGAGPDYRPEIPLGLTDK